MAKRKSDAMTRKRFEQHTIEEQEFVLNTLKEQLYEYLEKYKHQRKLNKYQLNTIIKYTHKKALDNSIDMHIKEITKHFYFNKNKWAKVFNKQHPDYPISQCKKKKKPSI